MVLVYTHFIKQPLVSLGNDNHSQTKWSNIILLFPGINGNSILLSILKELVERDVYLISFFSFYINLNYVP